MPSKKASRKSGGGGFYHRLVPPQSSKRPRQSPQPSSKSLSSKKPAKKVKANSKDKDSYTKGLVFVAMSFQGEGGEEAFRAIKESCKSIKLNARRVDENFSSGFIILEIVDLIERAEFIVFDLTHERPNVYYELGYAHGVGNSPSNILLLAKDGTKLHFDIAALRVRFYKSTEELKQIIKLNLTEMVKSSRQ